MVRTRTFDPSAALTAAVDVFAAKGYSETSMEDLVKATGVSRYGLYGTFGNKREIFEQVLDRYAENMGKRLYLKLLEPDASIADIHRIFEERVADITRTDISNGCLFVHTTMELASQDPELQAVLRKFMKGMSRAFSVGLEYAQGRGEVRSDIDVRAAGELLTSTMFGLAVLGRTGFTRDSLMGIVNNTLNALKA